MGKVIPMYAELVKRLREHNGWALNETLDEAADAIESVSKAYQMIAEVYEREVTKPKWIMIKSRPMDEEERRYYSEHYGYNLADDEAVIYCCQLPEHGQEVLVCDKYGHIWLDTFDDDPDYGVGFETNGDMDGLAAWMPLPTPPEEEI